MASYDDPATQTIIKDLQIKFEQEYRSNPGATLVSIRFHNGNILKPIDDFNFTKSVRSEILNLASEKNLFSREIHNCIYSDYQRVMTDLHYVYRFYRARHCNPDAALDMMISTMKWRKCTVKLDHYRDYSFPIEFYKVSAVFPYEPDKSGYTTIYIRVSQHRKVPELEEYTKAFFVHVFDKVDRIHGAKGYSLVFDLTSASYRNLDWDYLKFMINFGANYCPAGVKYILVLNVPWALNTFRKMVFSFLNDDYFKLIKFVNGNQIYEHIDPENVPHYLGGKCKRNYCSVPKHSMPIEELVERYGYTKDDYKRIIPVYQDALDQADQFLSTVDWNEPEDYFDTPEKDEKELQGTNYEGKNNVQVDLNDNEVVMEPATAFAVKPVDTIDFQYSLIKGRYSGSLRIENNWYKSVCFKVQSNHPNDYQVSPRFGVVKANSAVDITINLLNQDWSHWSKMNMMNRSSKFRILINTCTLNLEETMTIDQFNKQWSTKDKGIYSIIRETRLIKEFPVKMGRRDKFRQPATDLFQHKLPKWSDDLSVEDKLRCLSSSANSLESNQRKLSLMLYLMGFAYLMLFCYFLISNPSFAPSIVN